MIIKGKVHTLEGPVDVQKIKVGDKVIDFGHRPQEVTAIKKKRVKKAVVFSKNKNLIISEGAFLYTIYGKRQGGFVKAVSPNGEVINDETSIIEGDFVSYIIEFDGEGIFIENYCIGA